ncbi:F-box-like/WD repeat-containing protein TBL1XR1 [Babesia sp. Xinjiang]|uniref:F-box-like/WD repeat-containing protein TBL1XR1 n=1 Tax=Babesia sp. Xinjiang TaxID=462227 RepID=UPI000A234A04|nr:F-box-like/WD repeat-containing protein TBL1XR1 [Babesia sp. Xinjiang]ORM41895.1 F-box-like/WD repeat-containing protein TBL1XR1 [Babesia sp. Xinjiang]
MKINLTSDDINLLVYRYLIENGYSHTAFSFNKEAEIARNPYYNNHADKIPPNALVSFMQKAMIYIYLEYHTDDLTGDQIVCDEPFSFFRKHACFRKLGQQNGLPIKESTPIMSEHGQHATSQQQTAMGERSGAGVMDTNSENPESNSLVEASAIYLGPPQRRLADKWQVFGYMRLLEYGPKGAAAVAYFNPAFPAYIVKRLEDAPPAMYQISKKNRVKTCEMVPPIAMLRETDGDVEVAGTCLRWRHDGRMLCTGYASGSVAVWNTCGQRLFGIKASNTLISAIAFSGNRRFWNECGSTVIECKLAVGDADGRILVFRVYNGLSHLASYNQGSVVTEIDWKDNDIFAAASADAKVVIYDTATNASTVIQDAVESNPLFMEWGPVGRCLAMLDNTNMLKLYKPNHNGVQGTVTSLGAHTKNIVAASWQFGHNPKSANRICTVAMDKQLLVWDVVTDCVVTSILLDQVPTTVAVNAMDTFVAVGTYGNLVKIFNLPTLTLSCSFCDQGLPTSVTWASDGDHIAYNVYNQQRTSVLPITTSTSVAAD